jgi:hypothetical protein
MCVKNKNTATVVIFGTNYKQTMESRYHTVINIPPHSPDDKRFEVVSLPGPVSGCVTCSTSSALAESCTLKSKPPENANYTDGIICSLVPHICQFIFSEPDIYN